MEGEFIQIKEDRPDPGAQRGHGPAGRHRRRPPDEQRKPRGICGELEEHLQPSGGGGEVSSLQFKGGSEVRTGEDEREQRRQRKEVKLSSGCRGPRGVLADVSTSRFYPSERPPPPSS